MGWRKGEDTVYCLRAGDGTTVWSKSYPCPRYGRHAVGDQGVYSGPTSTPTFDRSSKLLFTLSADGDLMCWNAAADGAGVWQANLYERYNVPRRPNVGRGRRDYGYTTAPLVRGDSLLAAVGGPAGLLIAFDKRTGKELWASQCKDFASNAGGMTPIDVDDIPCVAVLSLRRLVIVRIDKANEGRTLATYPWQTDYANNLVTPSVVGNQVILSSAYNLKKMVLIEVTARGIHRRWESGHYTGVCSPVVYDGRIYTAYRKLRCLELSSGELVWEGGAFSADGSCLVTADGRLVVFGNGQLALVNTALHSPKAYQVLARRAGLCRKSDAWPHVVLAAGRVYCKDRLGNVSCFVLDSSPEKAPPADTNGPRR